MALILDTNALSAFADGDSNLRRKIEQETELALPAVVLGEYLFGVRRSRLRRQYEDWLRAHRKAFLLLPVGGATAEHYAAIRSELKSAGQPIPSNDIWIAAVAREHGFKIVTQDRHFEAIQGLRLVPW